MSLNSQQYADLAENTYDRDGSLKRLVGKEITLDGVTYKVLEHVDKPSGYQGTVYQRKDTGDIVVAHRGSEFGREPIKDGVFADGGMVMKRTNNQTNDAIELTQRAIDRAENEGKRIGKPAPEVTVTGHSLGGGLAQITAHHFNLKGETFNAYGAVSLGYRIPEGGGNMLNHVMAGDPVSAASKHYGQVRVYAQPNEIDILSRSGHLNTRLPIDAPFRQTVATAVALGGSHRMHNFLNVDGAGKPDISALGDPNTRRLAEQYDPMIDKYRDDVAATRGGITLGARGPLGNLKDAIEQLRGPVEPGEPSGRQTPTPAPKLPPIGTRPEDIERGFQQMMMPAAFGSRPKNGSQRDDDPARQLQDDPGSFVNRMLAAAKSGDNDTFRQLTQAAANSDAGRDLRSAAVATVDHQEQQALQQQAQPQAMNQPLQDNPVRAMRIG